MKALIPAVALAFLVVSHAARAQDSDIRPEDHAKRQAPVGHRQPTVADVQRAQAQKGIANSSVAPPKSSDIDRRLIICQGC